MCAEVMTVGKGIVLPDPAQLTGVSTSAMASGDWINDAICEFTGFERASRIEVLGVRLWEAATAQKKDIRVWLFSGTVAGINSNDAATMTAAEALTLIGVIDIEDTDYINTATTESYAQKMLSVPFAGYLPTDKLYAYLTAREAVTYTSATPIKIQPIVRQHE